MLSFLTSLTVVPSILAIEIEEDTYERVAGTGLFDLKSLSAPASIYTTQTQTSPLDANLSNVTCMAFLLEDETGVTGTFFQDDVELTTAAIYVPDDYPTIQEAVNAASDGDTIIVRDGTYTENVVVDKRLTIQSENGAENCIVVGQPDHPGDCVFAVTADYVNISGFTVKVEETVVHLYVTAISLDNVDYCNIINNNCPTCNIDLDSSNNNILNNNTVSNTWIGISLYDSSSNTLTNNNCSNNTNDGIHLYESNNNILINNMIVSKGIDVYDSYQNIVENNTVNGKPLVYLEDETDCRIAYAGQVVLVNCDNITVENLNLSNVSVGVDLWGTDNSKLMNITTQGNDYGIYLYESNNNSVSSNNCLNNEDGIYLLNSDSNLLFSNNCSNNSGDGIYLGLSNNNLLINNMFENDGVEIDYSYQNVVENNTVNGKPLVYLEDETDCRIADAGQVILVNCDNITVENQNLSNASVGLELTKTPYPATIAQTTGITVSASRLNQTVTS
jgi:parallel beta-helix repeat protein